VDSPGPLLGHTSRLRSFWGGCWNKPVAVPAQWQEGLRCMFLMTSTHGRLLVLGGNPLHGSDTLDSRMGACLWEGGGGEEELQGTTAETFSQDDASSKQPCLCYILYISQWGFRCSMSSGHDEGGPRSSIALGRHMSCSTSTTRRPSPRIEDGEGVVDPRSTTDSTEQWV
jgi:hypothetical protein